VRPARVCLAAAVLAAAALVSPARAAGSFADREAARGLAGKAYEAFEAGQYHQAVELFQQAEAHFHAPPHLLYTARALVKLHRLREARVTFERMIAEKLPLDAPGPFKDAQATARSEITEVEALTPNLTVSLAPSVPPGARVIVDGEPLAPGDLGRPLPRDPGAHAVVLQVPGAPPVERKVVLVEGRGDEQVTLSPAPSSGVKSVVPAVITFSIGAAGLIAGTTGAVLQRTTSSTPLRAMEVAGFTTGGLGVSAGVILIALWAKGRPAAASVHVGVGPAALSLGGTF
jgi:hypothetical protein